MANVGANRNEEYDYDTVVDLSSLLRTSECRNWNDSETFPLLLSAAIKKFQKIVTKSPKQDEKVELVWYIMRQLLQNMAVGVVSKWGRILQCTHLAMERLGDTFPELMLFLQDRKDNETVKALVKFLEALQDHEYPPDVPVIVWQTVKGCSHHLGKFVNRTENSESITLQLQNIQQLKHSTNAITLLQMFNRISDGVAQFIGKRNISPGKRANICPQGLVYFSVDLADFNEKITNRFAKQRRYGAASIKLGLNNIKRPGSTRNYDTLYKLGTKQYTYEYSEIILATDNPDGKWWLIGTQGPFEINCLAKLDNTGFKWHITYDDDESWTHPEVVVPGDFTVDLKFVKIKFEDKHECIKTADGRRDLCIECKIRQQDGVSYGKTGESWNLYQFKSASTGDLCMAMFAYSCPLDRREWFESIQETHTIFEEDQLKYIKRIWETMPDSYVSEWRLQNPEDKQPASTSSTGGSPAKISRIDGLSI